MLVKDYSNSEDILSSQGRSRGLIWKSDTIDFLKLETIAVVPNDNPLLEFHLYSPNGDKLLTSSVIEDNFRINQDEVFIDYSAELQRLNIERGYFRSIVNIHRTLLGSPFQPAMTVKEISPDRRELQIVIRPDIEELTLELRQAILNSYLEEFASAYASDLFLNFGSNKIYKILNHKEWINEEDLVIRLYEPLKEDIELNDIGWIVEQLSDPIIDEININVDPVPIEPNYLRGPNFEIDTDYNIITETGLETWNSLLDANLSTSQKIIDSYFSGSLSGIDLNIDYTGFNNFVHYSSAKERIDNFKFKLELLEYYDTQISKLNSSLGVDAGAFQNNISKFEKRKDNVIGEFDSFEKWLYNEPTASLTTHGVSGSYIAAEGYCIKPYPKFISSSKFHIHETTSTIATSWFNGVQSTASLYDEQNENGLVKTIPEHIRLDSNNSEFELFVNMIGHHFDILWTYVDSLSRLYKLEEQPKLGLDKKILPDIAKSLGWTLTNGKQASQLWQYRLGVDSTGSYQSTGNIFSQSDEEITGEVWRRIVNNLPHLLKTKGTERSIKALMNMYGIPQTLLSIREYGGPKTTEDTPALIEDRFSYAVQFNSGSNINFSSNHISASIDDWGIEKSGVVIPPITREFRFRPYSASNMMLYSQNSSSQIPQTIIAVEHTASYSGSSNYGRILLSYGKAVSDTIPMTASTDWVPIFNGQYWNVRYYYTTTGSDNYNNAENLATTYNLQVQNGTDFIKGRINFSSSLSLTPTYVKHYESWSEPSLNTDRNKVYIGGSTSSGDNHNVAAYVDHFLGSRPDTFTGSMQEYREWLEEINEITFDRHTLNPTSYASALSVTSSYDTLVRQYTLGSNTIGVDLSSNETIISSSHPNQNIKDFTKGIANSTNATSIGFETPDTVTRGNFVPVEETYFVEGISSGMNSAKSQKIRFDNNTLVRQLNSETTAERSKFDYASLDSNKLGLFYSYADQVNKDIFNQIGDAALDDYIGEPEDQFKNDYPLLKNFSEEYWKKYLNKSDINSYIRIFSQFDFALFKQIQQLLAERIDEVTGLLIEPHALERSKQKLISRPSITNPQYNFSLSETPTSSMEFLAERSASIIRPLTLANSTLETNLDIGISSSFSASLQPLNDIIVTGSRTSRLFKTVIYHFSGSDETKSKIQRNADHAVSQSAGRYYSKSLAEGDYMDDFNTQDEKLKFVGSKLIGPGINLPSVEAALDNLPIVEIFETNPKQLIFSKEPKAPTKGNVLSPGNIIIK
jgi:hypothetical protein